MLNNRTNSHLRERKGKNLTHHTGPNSALSLTMHGTRIMESITH